jgi:hypothetical protein
MLRNYNQYDYAFILDEIMKKLRNPGIPVIFPENILENINQIQKIARERYSNDKATLRDILCREILLDANIADLLNEITLKKIFSLHVKNLHSRITLKWQQGDNSITLANIIYNTLADGPDFLELMPNHYYSHIEDQKKKFQYAGKLLLENVLNLATHLNININDYPLCKINQETNLVDRLDNIVQFIDSDLDFILSELGNRENPRKALNIAFMNICDMVKCDIDIDEDITYIMENYQLVALDSFVDKFVTHSTKILYHHLTCKFFLEESQLINLLGENRIYDMKDEGYKMRDILRAIIVKAENNKESDLYLQFQLRIHLLENKIKALSPKKHLPDNVFRSIEIIEKCKAASNPVLHPQYQYLIDRLMKTTDENHLSLVLNLFPHDLFTRSQIDELQITSLTNSKLLEAANFTISHHSNLKHKYCREIEGRLLRTNQFFGYSRNIESMLKDNQQKYSLVSQYVCNDFLFYSQKIRQHLVSENNAVKGGAEKGVLLTPLLKQWKNATGIPHTDLYLMRDNLLLSQQKLIPLEEPMKLDRHSLLSHLYAAFVGLGCITVPFIGVPLTIWAMCRSKRDKNTVFFTHAPETMKIVPEVKGSLRMLGK